MCVHLFEARCYGSKNEKQCRKHRMKNERICKMDDCEECLKGFDDAGGCQAPPEDAHDYIPEGCDPCGDHVGDYCDTAGASATTSSGDGLLE